MLVIRHQARNLCPLLVLVALVLPVRAEELSPAQQARSNVQAARLEMGCKNYARAVELLEAALALQPHWIVPHEYLALAYQQMDSEEKAVAEYVTVQRLSYDFSPSGRSNPPEVTEQVLLAEATTMWLVNQARLQNGLSALRPEPRLSIVAREHSLEMRDLGYFDHASPTPSLRTSLDRFRSVFNFLPALICENIARRWGSENCFTLERIRATHQDLLNSPRHRENLLCREVSCMGVGIAVNAQGHYWLTQEFARYGTGQ